MLNRWSVVRAVLIAAALLLGGLSAIPEPSPRQLPFLPWPLRAASEAFEAVRRPVIAQVRFVPETFQFDQRWRLFSGASDARFRMSIEARESETAPWRTIYRPHDAEHTWLASTLEYRRVRGNWNPSRRGPNRGYDGFVTWVARRVFAEHPQYHWVRVRMEEIRLLPGGRGFASTDRFLHEIVRERAEVMRDAR